ncbi:unnamed protein product [Closterium sp. NIES-64]|nr:unnamed protein product [Closterium sp. NIES-64]
MGKREDNDSTNLPLVKVWFFDAIPPPLAVGRFGRVTVAEQGAEDRDAAAYKRLMALMKEEARPIGYLHGRGALDHDDLNYLREHIRAEEETEKLRQHSEKRAFAALKIRSSPTCPLCLCLLAATFLDHPAFACRGGSAAMATPEQLVLELSIPEQRENALLDLSKEVVAIYPMLSPPTLTAGASNRACNALAVLQCVASHPETRVLFLNAHIPLYLYPFLNTVSKTRPFEYLRLTSLGVIGALVKVSQHKSRAELCGSKVLSTEINSSPPTPSPITIPLPAPLIPFTALVLRPQVDDTDVVNFLLSTEIIPLCLRTMEMGSELSKTVATFIVQKILLDDVGLAYICATAERFFAVSAVLGNMVQLLAEHPSVRLLKHIIRCYLRLSDNPRAGEALRTCLPDLLRDATFSACLRDDVTTRRWLAQLLINVGPPLHQAGGGGGGGVGGGPPGPPQALHGGGGNPVHGGPGAGGVGMHGGGGAGALHSSSPSPLHGTSSPMHAAQRPGQMGGPMGVVGGMGGGVGGMGLPPMDTLPPVN